MKQSLAIKVFAAWALVIILAVMLILAVLYAISPRTVRAPIFIVQGWACHHIAQTLESGHFSTAAVQYQQYSIEGYVDARKNLDAEPLDALVSDEWRALANIYINRRDYTAASTTLDRVEALVKKQIKSGTQDEDRWRRSLGTVLWTHARIYSEQGLLTLSLNKYKEVLINAGELMRDHMSDASTDVQLKEGSQELASVVNRLRITGGKDEVFPGTKNPQE